MQTGQQRKSFYGALMTVIVFSLTGVMAALASAAPAATVQTVSGELKVRRKEQAMFMVLGKRGSLYVGDIVQTGRSGKSTLLFEDGSQIRLNASSTVEITPRVAVGRGKYSLFRTIGGEVWARLRPNNAAQTRSAIAGVRGTVFQLKVEADDTTTLTVLEGQVDFFNQFGAVAVDPSQQSVARLGGAPSAPLTIQNPGLTIEWSLDLDRALIPREKFFISLDQRVVQQELTRRRQRAGANDAAAHLALGDALFDSHQYAEALRQYQAAEQIAPRQAVTATRIGHALLEMDRLDEAAASFRSALGEDAGKSLAQPVAWDGAKEAVAGAKEAVAGAKEAVAGAKEAVAGAANSEALVGLSWTALKGNRPAEARDMAEAAISSANKVLEARNVALTDEAARGAEDAVSARVALGLALMRQPGQLEAAAQSFESALKLEPANRRYQAHAWLALVRLSQDDAALALREAEEATRLQPNSGLAHGNLSLVLFFAGKPRQAQQAAQQAVELDPDSVAARCALGQALLAQGEVDAASRTAAQAVALDPEQPQARYLLGVCDASRRDYRHAVPQLKESVQLAPDFLPAVSALARVYSAMGRKNEAVELVSGLLPRSRRADGVRAALGLVRYEQGDYAGAAREYRAAIKSKPNSALYHAELARTLTFNNQLNAAIEAGQKAVRLAPNIGQYHATLGQAYDYSGLKSQAERELRQALTLDPRNALALSQLAYRHQAGNDLRPVAGSYTQAFLFDPGALAQLLRGGVDTEITPTGGSGGDRNIDVSRHLSAADGKLHVFGFLNRDADGGVRDNDKSSTSDFGQYATYQAGTRTNLYLNLRRVGSRRQLPGLESQPDDDDRSKLGYGQAQFALRRRIGERHSLWLGLFGNNLSNTTTNPGLDSFFDANSGLAVSTQKLESRALQPEIRFDLALNNSQSRPGFLTLGLAQAGTKFHSRRDLLGRTSGRTGQANFNEDYNSTMGYVQLSQRVSNRLSLIAGLRAQNLDRSFSRSYSNGLQSVDGEDLDASSQRSRSHLLPSLLATYQADKKTTLRLSFNRRLTDVTASTFAPTDSLISTEPSTLPFGTPETMQLMQLDVERYVGSRSFVKFWVFDNSAKNIVIGGSGLLGFGAGLAGADAPALQMASWKGRGAGVRLEHQLSRNLFANLSYVGRTTSNRSFGPLFTRLWDGQTAPYEPSRFGNFELNYIDPRGNKMGLRLRHVGSFFQDSPLAIGRPRFGAKTYVDLRLAREPSLSREFFVQVSFLFAEPHFDFNGFPTGKRQFEFGMTQRF